MASTSYPSSSSSFCLSSPHRPQSKERGYQTDESGMYFRCSNIPSSSSSSCSSYSSTDDDDDDDHIVCMTNASTETANPITVLRSCLHCKVFSSDEETTTTNVTFADATGSRHGHANIILCCNDEQALQLFQQWNAEALLLTKTQHSEPIILQMWNQQQSEQGGLPSSSTLPFKVFLHQTKSPLLDKVVVATDACNALGQVPHETITAEMKAAWESVFGADHGFVFLGIGENSSCFITDKAKQQQQQQQLDDDDATSSSSLISPVPFYGRLCWPLFVESANEEDYLFRLYMCMRQWALKTIQMRKQLPPNNRAEFLLSLMLPEGGYLQSTPTPSKTISVMLFAWRNVFLEPSLKQKETLTDLQVLSNFIYYKA